MSKLLPVHPGQQVALVDDADDARVSPYRWCLSSQGYAVARIASRLHYLQRFLLAPASRAKIIYRNGDKLDNRRESLVVVTHAQARGCSCIARAPFGVPPSRRAAGWCIGDESRLGYGMGDC